MRRRSLGITFSIHIILLGERDSMKPIKVLCMVFALTIALLECNTAIAAPPSGGGGGKSGYSGGGHGSGYSGRSGYRGEYYKGGHKGGHYGGRGYYGRSYRGRGYYRGYYGSGFNVWLGGPWWYYPYYYPYSYPYYPYYPYYYPPAVSVPTEPQTYIEKQQREGTSAPAAVWYFCPDSKSYYPYVKECPGGWQTVPAQPPPGPEK